MTKNYDILIVGGSLSGLTFGIGAAKLGYKIGIFDICKDDFSYEQYELNRTCAISPASVDLYKSLGLFDIIKGDMSPMHNIFIQDAHPFLNSQYFDITYKTSQTTEDALGYVIYNKILQKHLREYCNNLDNIDFYYNTELISLFNNPDNVKIHTTGGEFTGKLLVGADGKFSKVRELLGINSVCWDFNQYAIVCTIKADVLISGFALERFFAAGPFAALPVGDGKYNIVWSIDSQNYQETISLPISKFTEVLINRLGQEFKNVEVISKISSYPLSFHHAQSYYSGRGCLIADSAHVIHPIAGQGFNMGLRDIGAFLEILKENLYSGSDIGSVKILKDYEDSRRFDNTSLSFICDSLVRIYKSNNIIIKTSRDLFMGIVEKVPTIKSVFIKHAMGRVGVSIPNILSNKRNG